MLFWQVFQLRLTGFLYYDLCAWENKTLTHKLIDGLTFLQSVAA